MRQFLSLNPRAFMRRRFVAVIVAAASLGAVGLTAAGPAAAPAAAENNGLGAVPLMGWSNWSYIGDDPTTAKIEAQASAMVSTGLHSAGWDYINVDDYYYLCNSTGPEVNAYGLWVTDPSKFPPSGSTPGMEVLANYVHGLGLKFGMYVTPGIPENAVNANTPVQGTSYTAAEIANTSVSEHNYNCGHMYGLNYSSPGAQDYINSWADELASWGVDYVKLDGVNSSDIPDVQAWSAALRQTGRPMWLELSNDLPIADHSYWQEYSNGWRTNGDIECYCWPGGAKSTNPARTPLTTWSNVAGRFGTLASWYPYAGPGGWLDFDSLEVGNGPTNDGISDPEAQSMMTLWSMGASNLILGTNLTALTPTDLGYLKNTAVLSVDQDGLAAHRVVDSGSGQVFVKTESNGDCVLAYFDTSGTSSASVSANVSSACGFTSGTATNLWTGASLGTLSGTYTVNLGAGATELLRIVPSGGTTTTTSGGSSYPSGYHTLVVDNDGLCVEVAGASTSNGAAIDQNTCSGGTNQEFQFNPVSGGYGELQAESDGKDVVVASASTAEGAKVIQYTQNGTTNGLWLPIAQSDGSWQFKNENSGYCLDVTGAVNTPGTQLQQWGCKSPAAGTNQAYAATTGSTGGTTTTTRATTTTTGATTTTTSGAGGYPSGYHTLVVDNDGLCVEVAGASTSNGAAIDQNTCSGGTNQEFQFNPVSGGYGELQAESDGKDVVVLSASTAEGAKVIQYTQNGTTNGLWLPIAQSDGSWQFKNENSGYCLDVTGAVNTPGTQLQQWGCKSPAAGTNQAYMAK